MSPVDSLFTSANEEQAYKNIHHHHRHHQWRHRSSHPLAHSRRRKPRRWPLALRFIKGAIHKVILIPVLLHTIFAAVVVVIHVYGDGQLSLPTNLVPSLSIVVGLMLVFRNQTSYDRFWNGRNQLSTIVTSLRNLTRSILCYSYNAGTQPSHVEEVDIERVVRILMAIPYAVKHHLRSEWDAAWTPTSTFHEDGADSPNMMCSRLNPEFCDLLPPDVQGYEGHGLGFVLELTFFVESFIKRGHDRGWYQLPQSSHLTVQLNNLVDAYGRMETISTTPLPVAILIHQKQVLALFGCILPFGMVGGLHWLTVPIVATVMFTLYGIEGIGAQLEDPFGYERNGVDLDAVVEDARTELGVMLSAWKKLEGPGEQTEMFLRTGSSDEVNGCA